MRFVTINRSSVGRRGLSLLAAATIAGAFLTANTSAYAATAGLPMPADSADVVSSEAQVGVGFTTTIDPKTHTVTVGNTRGILQSTDGTGKVTSQRSIVPTLSAAASSPAHPQGLGSYQCIVDTQQNSNFRGYTPQVISNAGNDYQYRWQFNGYSVDNARYISGYWTFQTEQCFTGGGTSTNGFNQWYVGASTTEDHDQLIGDVWGTTVTNNTVSTTLNFNVSAGPVSIGGSTTVNGADTHGGQLGNDPNESYYPWSSSLDGNRVDSFYLAPHDYIWDGTPNFEGNNGQALWEQPENGGGTTTYNWAEAWYLCDRPNGIGGSSGCGAFN